MLSVLDFAFSDRETRKVDVWGRGDFPLPAFGNEELPAFFTRTLALDRIHLPEGACMTWMFTGPRGGLTMELRRDRVDLYLRHTDSMGFFPEADALDAKVWTGPKHPEIRRHARQAALDAVPERLTLTVDRALRAVLAWEGGELSLPLPPDLHRYQLRLHEAGAEARGRVLAPSPVEVLPAAPDGTEGQRIRGFGGIASIPAWRRLSPAGKADWLRRLRESNWLIQREYPTGSELDRAMDNWDRPEDAVPHYYGDNFPNGETSDFDYNRQIQDLGGEVWFEFWTYPRWVQAPTGQGFGPVDEEAYVRAMLAYCQAARERTGRPPAIVGVQNEISPTAEDLARMLPRLRRGLDAAGFAEVKIHMANSSSLAAAFQFLEAVRADPEAWAAIDYIATNEYDAMDDLGHLEDYAAKLRRFRELGEGKPVLSPEISVPQPRFQGGGYRLAAVLAELFHYNLTDFAAEALCYCWTLLETEQENYEETRSLCGLDESDGYRARPKGFLHRAFNAFSRSLPPGCQRLPTASAHPDLLDSLWRLPDGRLRRICFNRGTAPLRVAGLGAGIERVRVDAYWDYETLSHTDPGFDLIPPGGFLLLTHPD